MPRRLPVICILLLTLFSVRAYAAEDTYYIFQLDQSAEGVPLPAHAQPVYEAGGIYRTNDLSVIRSFEQEDALVTYTLDGDISLFDDPADAEALQNENWSRAMLGASYAAGKDLYGTGVRIALIDSGIRPDFGDITGATVLSGINYLVSEDSDRRNNTSDSTGHGTFVASIISSDVTGLAPQAELVPLKCFAAKTTSISYVISAIYAAVDEYQCDVINLSLGTTTDDPFLREAIAYAYDHGVIMVAASGNLSSGAVSTGNDPTYYPAAYDEVISVGALDEHKQIASFSVQNRSLRITAPGAGVSGLSLRSESYKAANGTSYAAPFVTAAAALAMQADPTLTPQDFMTLLQETAEDLGEEGLDNTYGYGCLNVGLLLARILNDSESMILSRYDGRLCFSAYQPDLNAAYQLVLARYEPDGRFGGCSFILSGEGGYSINNYALPNDSASFSLFTLEHGSFAPLSVQKPHFHN